MITTATYQVTTEQLREECNLAEKCAEAVMHSSVRILSERRTEFWDVLPQSERNARRYPKLGASMGPYSAVLPGTDEYSGRYDDVAQGDFFRFHASRCHTLDKLANDPQAADCDVYCFETIGNTEESVAIVEAMTDATRASVPYWISFQCRDSERIACGEKLSSTIEKVLRSCSSRNLVAIGVNCVNVNNVKHLIDLTTETVKSYMSNHRENLWRVDSIAYPNSGEVWGGRGWVWPEHFPAHDDQLWADIVYSSGARLIGGCCRIGPREIRALHAKTQEASRTGL